MKTQKGFTITELLAVLMLLFWFACVVGIIYVALHFIAKFW
jgi:type II secretory pathway pseudopilin PulG